MSRWTYLTVLMVLGVCVTGCIEKKEKITLNPDGSGKTEIDVRMQAGGMNIGAKDQAKPDPQTMARNLVNPILTSSGGVDAWKDVSYKVEEDGRTHFVGTAYFSDLSKVDLKNIGKLNASWAKQPDGSMRLEIQQANKPAAAAAAPALTDEQIAAKVKEAKAQYTQSKPMMAGLLTGMKLDVTYLLPGKIEKSGVFKPVAGGVQLQVTGEQMLQGMDKLMADDAKMAAALKAGREAGQGASEEELNELILGARDKIYAQVSGADKAQFDYAAEVAAAKAAQPAMFKQLGVEQPAAAAPMGAPQ